MCPSEAQGFHSHRCSEKHSDVLTATSMWRRTYIARDEREPVDAQKPSKLARNASAANKCRIGPGTFVANIPRAYRADRSVNTARGPQCCVRQTRITAEARQLRRKNPSKDLVSASQEERSRGDSCVAWTAAHFSDAHRCTQAIIATHQKGPLLREQRPFIHLRLEIKSCSVRRS
jgi:hypothetical protein